MDPKTEAWRKAAHDVITELAATNSLIVSDMVVAALETAGMGLNNYSALGGVFTRAAKAGLIVKTDETAPGNRKSHSAKTVWRSLVYKKAEAVSPELEALSAMVVNALDFNAGTIRLASMVYGHFGDMKRHQQKKIIDQFNDMQDKYVSQHVKISDELLKRINPERSNATEN